MNQPIFLIEDLSQQHLQARSVAAVLHQAKFQTRLIDASEIDTPTIVSLATQEQPRLIVASVLFADRIVEYLDLFTAMREANIRAHLTMIGPLPALASATLLDTCHALDSVLCNEPTATIAQLANTCHDSTQWQQIPGIAHRSPTPCINSLPPPIRVDDLPFALRDNITFSSYPFATLVASRGCYHACSFCLPCAFYREQGARYRLRSISNLIDEMELLYRDGVRLFLFDDEQFLPPYGMRARRITEFADELHRRNIKIAFTIKCRADDVDAALFRDLQNLGLLRIYIGIESGCQQTLDWIEKHTTVQQNTDALKTLDEIGIIANFQTLMFHPFATLESIHAEIEFLQSVIPFVSTLSSFREVEIYPGTPLAEQTRYQVPPRNLVSEYAIPDPRAELLRRLNRIVFATSYNQSQDALNQEWFDVLMQRRFQSTQLDTNKIQQLKSVAIKTNQFALDVWREMITFVESGNIYDAERVNERAADWTRKIKTFLGSEPRKV